MKPKSDSLKCVVIVRDIPPDAYLLPADGRQAKHKARQRQRLVMLLATYADADGSRIWPGAGTLARQLGMSKRAVHYLLDDLQALGFIENHGLTGERGTRIRKLNLEKIMQAAGAGAQSSVEPERTLPVQERNLHGAGVQSSIAGVQSSIAHNRPALPPTPPPPPPAPKSGKGVDEIVKSVATMGMGAPTKAAKAWLEKIVSAHGYETALQVVKQFMDRPGDLTKLNVPWALFAKEADTWLAVVIDKRRKAAAAVRANELAAELAGKGAMSAEEIIRATKGTLTGGIEDYFPDAVREAVDHINIEKNVQRQKDEHTRRWTAEPEPENGAGASMEDYLDELDKES